MKKRMEKMTLARKGETRGTRGKTKIHVAQPTNRLAATSTAPIPAAYPGATAMPCVRIMPDPSRHREYLATKCAFASRGDAVAFENVTGGPVDLQFPISDRFGFDSFTVPDNMVCTLTVGPYARDGEYPFAAYCQKDGRFARGGSMPIIIIEPKK
jgi:hypothetical protein